MKIYIKIYLNHNIAWLLIAVLSLISLAGCHSAQTGSKDDDLNSAMSEQQKALIRQHKHNAGE